MNEMGIWFKPVTMTEIDLPGLEVKEDFVFTRTNDGLELTRSTFAGESLSLEDWDEKISSIGVGAMCNADALKSVVLSRDVRHIGEYAFFQCENLTDVCIQGDLHSIGANAFNGCKALRNIYVPPTVKEIGEDAFGNIPDLTLCGAENSSIHRYAEVHGMFFMTAAGPTAA